ncbi:sensor/response regulator hybrid [Mesorhizobium sp. AA22]|nr:sensor/response regulator hybrid [Mesorhizobium sp. AA22]
MFFRPLRWREDMIEQQPLTSRCRSIDENTVALSGTDPRVLLASIVHDFNNFLTPIVTIMEEMQAQQLGTPGQLRRIDAAVFCAFRAQALARQLLDITTSRELRPTAVDIGRLLQSLEHVLRSVLPGGIPIRFDIADDLPSAFIDRQLMERALLNLILNARDAMPDAGEVVVAAAIDQQPGSHADTREPMIRLSVVDTGVGMDRATIRRAGALNFSTKSNGTGLGLAMVRHLMETQGGELSITSTPHQGTAIDLWLPVVAGSR